MSKRIRVLSLMTIVVAFAIGYYYFYFFSNGQTLDFNLTNTGSMNEAGFNGPMEGNGSPVGSEDLPEITDDGSEYSFSSTKYPYREMLSSDEQEVYNQIYANAVDVNEDYFSLVTSIDEDSLSDVMNALYNDHPELFWMNTSYKYKYNNEGQVVSVCLSYCLTGSSLDSATEEFNSVVSAIVSGASQYSDVLEQELYIHDYICDLTTYDENATMNQSAYSALCLGSTVCAGYARAFQYCCQELGITCYYVVGTASGGDHAWNLIEIDGSFYNVDVTWDDTLTESYGSNVYTYFNLTDSEISTDHTRTGLSVNLPSATSSDMSYTNNFGNTLGIDDITNNGGQLTERNFEINPPEKPVVDWRDNSTSTNSTPSNDATNAPTDLGSAPSDDANTSTDLQNPPNNNNAPTAPESSTNTNNMSIQQNNGALSPENPKGFQMHP